MQDLIERISATTGLDAATAERALGIMLNLVKTHGNQAKVGELLAKLPGAAELAAKHASNGGLLAMVGGPFAAISKLSAAGLSTEQIKQVATLTLAYVKDKAGAPLVRDAAGSIPGLGSYV
ncbi:MAG: DUF2780 domain-containing protein [Aestuariivirga sp.]